MTSELFAGTWVPPAELSRECPRPVRLTAAGKFVCALLMLLAFATPSVGVFMFSASYREGHTRTLLREQGIATTGNITRVSETGSRQSNQVTYRFVYGGVGYSSCVEAPIAIWITLQPRDPIAIRVLPADPAINHPAAWDTEDNPIWLPCLLVFFMFAWFFAFAQMIRRQYVLLSNGLPTPGWVTGCHYTGRRIVLLCQFRLQDGTIVKVRFNNAKRRAIGTSVCILYQRDNPRVSGVYPLSLVRVG
jgi:hypothetical protein